MWVEHHSSDTAGGNDTRKLGEDQHRTFNMHMPINETRSKPTALYIPFFVSMINFTRDTDTNDQTIGNGNISGITFTAAYINQPGITQHQVGWLKATRNLNATLKSVHKKYPPQNLVFTLKAMVDILPETARRVECSAAYSARI